MILSCLCHVDRERQLRGGAGSGRHVRAGQRPGVPAAVAQEPRLHRRHTEVLGKLNILSSSWLRAG